MEGYDVFGGASAHAHQDSLRPKLIDRREDSRLSERFMIERLDAASTSNQRNRRSGRGGAQRAAQPLRNSGVDGVADIGSCGVACGATNGKFLIEWTLDSFERIRDARR